MKRRNTFTRVSGSTFTCHVCGRLTRYTGVQGLGSELCPECWEIAGIDNEINDNGIKRTENPGLFADAEAYLKDIEKKGGNVAKVRESNTYAFPPVLTLTALKDVLLNYVGKIDNDRFETAESALNSLKWRLEKFDGA